MKKIKVLSFVFAVLLTSAVSAQEEEIHTTINSLGFEVSTLKELKTINWEDMLTIFEENAPQDSIEISIRVKDLKLENNKYNGVINNMSVKVVGISENKSEIVERLARKTDKMIRILERLTK